MKITYAQLNDLELQKAIARLGTQHLPIKVAYNISKLQQKLAKEMNEMLTLYRKLVKEHAEKDEKGNVKTEVLPGNPHPQPIILPEAKEKFDKENEEMLKFEVDIPCHKISIADLEANGVKLTPFEMSVLEPLIGDLEVLEGGKNGAVKAPIPMPLPKGPTPPLSS